MPAFLGSPAIVLPPHAVTVDEIVEDIGRAHPDHPLLTRWSRIVGRTGVQLRHFTQPLKTVATTEDIESRNNRAFDDVCAMGVEAAVGALLGSGLDPADIDAVVTSHSTGLAVPGLDVHLVNSLRLNPAVSRVPLTQLGCAGGAHALVRAADYLRAHPGRRVLVVVAETLSTVYQHSETTTESMIYKALFGDSAGAVVVTDTPVGGGPRIDDTWEYVIPDSTERYRMRLDGTGQHFESTAQALESMADLIPPLLDWYRRDPEDSPAFLIAHTGGPRILSDLQAGLDCAPELLDHSWAGLRDRGNLGGVAVLDVLARHFTDPPAAGSTGLLVGVGPGFTAAACRTTWSAE
ncbi:type III polyketide synthase [Streptacidiphilus cavernicola]|uniref:Type III polyketide synthase n=1 Tax=Streptacidiphilus cavernicola TaxID=3342716 RepID=A0ABV6VP60_9ACTN